MAYATAADMIARFGTAELIRMTTPEGAAMEAIDTAAVDRALVEASDVIDSYLRTRYAVPLATVPPSVPLDVSRLMRRSATMVPPALSRAEPVAARSRLASVAISFFLKPFTTVSLSRLGLRSAVVSTAATNGVLPAAPRPRLLPARRPPR